MQDVVNLESLQQDDDYCENILQQLSTEQIPIHVVRAVLLGLGGKLSNANTPLKRDVADKKKLVEYCQVPRLLRPLYFKATRECLLDYALHRLCPKVVIVIEICKIKRGWLITYIMYPPQNVPRHGALGIYARGQVQRQEATINRPKVAAGKYQTTCTGIVMDYSSYYFKVWYETP